MSQNVDRLEVSQKGGASGDRGGLYLWRLIGDGSMIIDHHVIMAMSDMAWSW